MNQIFTILSFPTNYLKIEILSYNVVNDDSIKSKRILHANEYPKRIQRHWLMSIEGIGQVYSPELDNKD